MLPDGLVTEDGRRFRVVYPGRANARAGPDFHDAILVTESGETVTGDVELHLRAPAWYGHRHHTDPNYNGVILHVVLTTRGKAVSAQQSGMEAPIVSIGPVARQLAGEEEATRHETLAIASDDAINIGGMLDRAGDARFLARSRGFALEMERDSPDQVTYRSLMEALGYASNRKPFKELAGRVPFSSLAALRYEPDSTRLLAVKAALLGASGLMAHVRPPEDVSLLKRLSKRMSRPGAISPAGWNLFRVRPANHPVVRILGAACIIERYLCDELARGLEEDFLQGGAAHLKQGGAAHLKSRFVAQPHIGESRAREIVVNVALPFLHAYGGLRQSPDLPLLCLEAYQDFPRLAENEITREMKRLLRIGNAEVTNARRQQGLIHIYKQSASGQSSVLAAKVRNST
jgi:hypothetical protein